MTPRHLRWLLVPVAALAAWYGALVLGLVGIGVLDALCPPEQFVSGLCTAPWYGPAFDGLALLCSAVAAAGIVLLPALAAPARRIAVAGCAYAAGASLALYAASAGGLWGPFLGAAIGGTLALGAALFSWR
jgi:hypothetical protein